MSEATRGSFFSRVRLIPLGALVVAATVAGIAGTVTKAQLSDASLQLPPQSTAAAGHSCVPSRASALAGSEQPWSHENWDASEAVWSAHAAEVKSYAQGANGWLFLGDDYVQNMSQAVGRETLSSQELAAFRQRYVGLDAELAKQGTEFVFMVAPAKWDVYPNELPAWMGELRGATTADILETGVPELNWIDPRDALAGQRHTTYSPVNSHWTDYGGYVAWDFAARCLEGLDGAYSATVPAQVSEVSQLSDAEHNEFAGYGRGDQGNTWTVPVRQEFSSYELTSADGTKRTVPGNHVVQMTDMPVAMHNPNAAVNASALVLGDSASSPTYR